MLASAAVSAQDCENDGLPDGFFEETFEDYDDGPLVLSDGGLDGNGCWDTWDTTGQDAMVTEEQQFSGDLSISLGGQTDIVKLFDLSSGVWVCRAKVFIPELMFGQAFFILLNTYAHGGTKNWSVQLVMDGNAGTVSSVGGSGFGAGPGALTPELVRERWVEVKAVIDLDNNSVKIYYDGELIDDNVWQTGGANTFQAIDLYSNDADLFYYDDVFVHRLCSSVEATPTAGTPPLEVSFDVSAEDCPAQGGDEPNAPIEVEWDFGDGETATSSVGDPVTHTYTGAGLRIAKARVTYADGYVEEVSAPIEVQCTSGDVSPWDLAIIGEPGFSGCASPIEGGVEIVGNGAGHLRGADEVVLVHQPVSGDFSVTCRLAAADWEVGANVGLEVRATLDADSPMLAMGFTRTDDAVHPYYARRTSVGGVSFPSTRSSIDIEIPSSLLRVDRVGTEVTGFVSTDDGATWEEITSRSLAAIPEDAIVGLWVATNDPLATATAQFTEITGLGGGGGGPEFRRGDTDANGQVQLTDAVSTLGFLFLGGTAPTCREAADSNNNGVLDLSDAVFVLNFLFSGGPPPAAPGPADCGPDTDAAGSPGDIGCESYPNC